MIKGLFSEVLFEKKVDYQILWEIGLVRGFT